MKKNKVSLWVAVLGVSLVALFGVGLVVKSFSGGSPKVVVEGNMTFNEASESAGEQSLGAAAGPFHTERQYFNAGFQSGGDVYATSSKKATYTLLASELDGDTTLIDWKPINSLTLTTMSSSSLQDLVGGVDGDSRVYWLQNSATTTNKNITIAAGTGVLMQLNGLAASSTPVLTASSTARMTFMRIPYNHIVEGTATTTANMLLLLDIFQPSY